MLALGPDRGAGYPRIMRSLRPSHRGDAYTSVLDSTSTPYPVAVMWGALDPILTLRRQGLGLLRATGLSSMTVVPGKHHLQEDDAPAVARLVDATAARA